MNDVASIGENNVNSVGILNDKAIINNSFREQYNDDE